MVAGAAQPVSDSTVPPNRQSEEMVAPSGTARWPRCGFPSARAGGSPRWASPARPVSAASTGPRTGCWRVTIRRGGQARKRRNEDPGRDHPAVAAWLFCPLARGAARPLPNLEVNLVLDEDIPRGPVDPVQIGQVVLNLARNTRSACARRAHRAGRGAAPALSPRRHRRLRAGHREYQAAPVSAWRRRRRGPDRRGERMHFGLVGSRNGWAGGLPGGSMRVSIPPLLGRVPSSGLTG